MAACAILRSAGPAVRLGPAQQATGASPVGAVLRVAAALVERLELAAPPLAVKAVWPEAALVGGAAPRETPVSVVRQARAGHRAPVGPTVA
jgi:hypothetical protein